MTSLATEYMFVQSVFVNLFRIYFWFLACFKTSMRMKISQYDQYIFSSNHEVSRNA
jgi:hypothetical protein